MLAYLFQALLVYFWFTVALWVYSVVMKYLLFEDGINEMKKQNLDRIYDLGMSVFEKGTVQIK